MADFLQRLAAWLLMEPAKMWLVLLSFPASMIAWHVWLSLWWGPDAEAVLRLTGMTLQLLGLASVVYGLSGRMRAFGIPHPLRTVRNWWTRRPGWRQHHAVGSGTAHIQLGGVSARGAAGVVAAGNVSLRDRVLVLERQIDALHCAVGDVDRRLEVATGEYKNAIDAERAARESADAVVREQVRTVTAGDVHLEMVGVFWLLAGIVLGSASQNLVPLLPAGVRAFLGE